MGCHPTSPTKKRNGREGKPPAFQFYPADWLADSHVIAMSLEEEGAYIRLLCICWREGSIPTDAPSLARLLKTSELVASSIWAAVGPCFNQDGTHPRLLLERAKQTAYRMGQSERAIERQRILRQNKELTRPASYQLASAGKQSAICNLQSASASALRDIDTSRKGDHCAPEVRLPFPEKSGRKNGNGIPPYGFSEFWNAYPRKKGRKAAERSWLRLQAHTRAGIRDLILSTLSRDSEEWQRQSRPPDRIPYGSTWLNAEPWRDAPEQAAKRREVDEWLAMQHAKEDTK